MKHTFKYLTTQELIYRKFLDIFSLILNKNLKVSSIVVPGYSLLKNLNALSSGTSALIGIFMKNETKQRVFVKKYIFCCKGLRYASLINELAILQLLKEKNSTQFPEFHFFIPELKTVKTEGNEITIICEYKSGEPLLGKPESIQLRTLENIFSAMKILNKNIKTELHKLPTRKTYIFAITFAYFWIKATIRKPSVIMRNLKLFVEFYTNYVLTVNEKNIYGLIHRDLHSRNILLDNTDIIITDWEGAVVTDTLYDLALIGRLYSTEISYSSLMKLLKSQLKTKQEIRRFLYLTLFYTIQTLALDSKKAVSYGNTEFYLGLLKDKIKPELLQN